MNQAYTPSEVLNRILMRMAVLLLACAFPALSAAQTVSGRILDAGTGESLIQASVRILNASDSTQVKATVTDANGRFSIPNLKKGRYIVEASYVGFTPSTQTITVDGSDLRIKPIRLDESAIALRETTVIGVKTPVKVMEDTVEYAADTYKTQPNAVVEDLLKRLPGVEVSSDGKITANGKEVTKILVDGKEFFSDDPTVASRNLPVNMVDKLQVVDRKSDLARLTGVDDGEDETVINLTVKKGMKNGWFGNVEGGYGTDNRYKGNFNINRFWNGNQITFLGDANNINEPGFADGASGRFRRFGGMNGITSSQSFGVNFNVGKDEIFRVGGDLMYSHTDRDTRTTRERRNILADGTNRETSQTAASDKGHNIRGDFRIEWKPDSFNTFDFRPNFSLNYNDSRSDGTSENFGTDGLALSRSINRSSSDGSSFEFGGRLIYNHKFRSRPGRSFSVHAQYRLSNVREHADTYSWNRFFQSSDDDDIYDQYADNHTWSNTVSGRLTWTEPLGNPKNGNFINVAYRFQYRWNNADKLTYDHPVLPPAEEGGDPTIDPELVFNEDLSNSFRNNYMNQDIRAGFKHVSKTNSLDVGVSLVPQMSRSIDLINSARNIPTRHVLNVAPYLRYRLKMSKTRSLNLNYSGRSSQPSMTQLQPVADMSDPLRVVIGNPELNPSFSHNLRLRFQDFNSEAQRSIMAMVFATVQQNAIISSTEFNPETGGQTTRYRNTDGVWNIHGMNMVSFPLRNKAFTFNNHLMLSYSSSVGYNNNTRNHSGAFSVGESFGFAWRPDNIELELRPSYRLQNTANSVQKNANSTVHSYGGTFYGTYYTPFGLVLGTDLNYTATSGYSKGYNTRTWMWNASIAYQFLRDRAATVTLRAYDLLGQRSNVQRTNTGNYFDDVRYNSLTRYVMVSFSYKFNTFGKGQEPADRNRRDFGPGMPPPPGGGRRQGAGGPPPRF